VGTREIRERSGRVESGERLEIEMYGRVEEGRVVNDE
jgi:hypothetical protein